MKNNRLKQIIKEEIFKFILNEASQINQLTPYANEINDSLNKMGNIDNQNVNDAKLKKFFHNFTTYSVQIIHAINRCVKANSLNEGAFTKLGDTVADTAMSPFKSIWNGLNLPLELGGNFANDFRKGYYYGQEILNGGKTNVKDEQIDDQTVPSIKLSVLLSNLPKWQNSYQNFNRTYAIESNYTYEMHNILNDILPRLSTTYNNLINAAQQQSQGTQNP